MTTLSPHISIMLATLLLASGIAGACAQTPGSAKRVSTGTDASTLAIVHVNVIPMNAPGLLPDQTVLVRGSRIAAIGPAAKLPVPKNAVRIDGTGKYLIPGLCDAHVHLQRGEETNRTLLQLFLVNGVTTVLNLYGTPEHLKLRAAAARGELTAPEIFTSGPTIGAPHGQPPTATPEQIANTIAAQKRAGYDVIKLHGDLSLEAYRRLMSASREQQLPVVGHAPRNLGVKPMLDLRQQAVAHVEEYLYADFYYGLRKQGSIPNLEQRIQALATATAISGTAVISTIEVYRGIADQITDLKSVLDRREVAYLPRGVGALMGWWAPGNAYTSWFTTNDVPLFRYNYRALAMLALGFQKAGVLLLAGTDTPTSAVVPGFSIHDELRDLVNAGLTPFQALQSATVNPATFLGYLRDRGTIEPDKRADLVLLKGNPLENIANTGSIAGVVRNGKWVSEAGISATLKQIAATNSRD